MGLRAHVELSRISGFIVCETFKIAPRNYGPGRSKNNIDIALKMLSTWQSQLPSDLQMPEDLTHPDPSCCILHMAHSQLVILTTRPVFFAAVKQAVAHRMVRNENPTNDDSLERHIEVCSAAAHRSLLLAQHVLHSKRKLLQAGLHFVFNAGVVLLLERIMKNTLTARLHDINLYSTSKTVIAGESESSIRFAIRVFEEEAKTGTNYPRDCCKILQDLKTLTDRYLASRDQTQLHQSPITDNDLESSRATTGGTDEIDSHTAQQSLPEFNPSHDEMMTWMQRDGLQLQNSLFI
jgi:hypothetical protein